MTRHVMRLLAFTMRDADGVAHILVDDAAWIRTSCGIWLRLDSPHWQRVPIADQLVTCVRCLANPSHGYGEALPPW